MVLDIPPSPGSEASTLPVPEGRETHEVEGKQTSGGSWPSGALRDHALARPVTLSVESQEPMEDMDPEGAGVSEGDESAVAEGGQPAEPGEDCAISTVLRHLQKLLLAVQNATYRLSRLMGRCEGAFDGICLDASGDGTSLKAAPYKGATRPMEVWEEQLANLDRSVEKTHTAAARPAPLLSEMIRRKVYQDLGRKRQSGKIPADDDETMSLGERVFVSGCSDAERAQAVHRVLIECIQDLERLSESNAELLAVEGVTV
eukprot:s3400_g3.t1